MKGTMVIVMINRHRIPSRISRRMKVVSRDDKRGIYKKKKVCLVCSSGGHFMGLKCLREIWLDFDRFWVTFPSLQTEIGLKGEKVYWAYSPTNRNALNFFKNLFLAAKILVAERPSVIVTTGAGVGVPFIYMGRLMGIKTVYLESLTRVKDLSLSGKLVYPFVDYFIVQWPELNERLPRTVYPGRVL